MLLLNYSAVGSHLYLVIALLRHENSAKIQIMKEINKLIFIRRNLTQASFMNPDSC
jgi:hypothetical protein